MYDSNIRYSYPRVLSPECSKKNFLDEIKDNLDFPEKVTQILRDEIERRVFEDMTWDIERMLFIEENQE